MKKQLIACIMFIALPVYASTDALEGMWEIGLVMRVEGQDYGPYTRQQCITKADAQDPAKLFADTGGTICEYTNKRYFGNQFSFNVRCNAGVSLTGIGQVEFSTDRFHGSMTLSAQMPDGPSVETASEISGKRLGACQQ